MMATVILILFGLCVGSFANVCIFRLPQGESLWHPPSHCPRCKTPILWSDNIPVFSYLFLKRRCRSCRGDISPRYPLTELSCGILWGGVGYVTQLEPWSLASGLVLMTGLLVASLTDADCRIIPNEVTALLMIAGVCLSPWNPLLGDTPLGRSGQSLVGLAGGAVFLWITGILGKLIWKKEAMGGGDVKLAGGLGAFLGWKGVAWAIIMASVLGAFWGLLQMALGKLRKRDYIPFGPFLAIGGAMTWLIQHGKTLDTKG